MFYPDVYPLLKELKVLSTFVLDFGLHNAKQAKEIPLLYHGVWVWVCGIQILFHVHKIDKISKYGKRKNMFCCLIYYFELIKQNSPSFLMNYLKC